MIKAVIFDFGQTLVDSAGGFNLAEKQVQERIFNDLDPGSWQKFIDNYRKIRNKFKEESNFSRKSMWKEVYSFFNSRCEERLLEEWELEYWERVKSNTKPFPETNRVLKELNTRYSLAVITNTQGQVNYGGHRINMFTELEFFFDTIIIAGESGIPTKPDPLPFYLCLEKLGLEKDQAVYVGDDWYIDIAGATNAGIKTIWLKHHSVKRSWPGGKITVPVITSLDRLLDLDVVLNNCK